MGKRQLVKRFAVENINAFKDAVYGIADAYGTCFIYDSCSSKVACDHKTFELIAGLGALHKTGNDANPLDALRRFHETHRDWIFGGLSYDLKNELEDLSSDNPDLLQLPKLRFVVPQHVILLSADGKHAELHSTGNYDLLVDQLLKSNDLHSGDLPAESPEFKSSLDEKQYLKDIENIRNHIRAGDVYELNYCMQFTANLKTSTSSMGLYRRLIRISPVPFAAFARFENYEIISASPERYIKKTGRQLISQPIKGTASRSASVTTDIQNRRSLQNSLKDRAENVMIVDLVRNDLARTCIPGSVQVEELFGIYDFPQVFQMISTVTGEMKATEDWISAIRHSFPMGSMTGAPKIAAMKLIEQYEVFKRGWYSGSLGYVSPEGDFDFNVLIRSLIINREKGIMTYAVGGAITIDSDPGDEYQECMWKASAIRSLFDRGRNSGN